MRRQTLVQDKRNFDQSVFLRYVVAAVCVGAALFIKVSLPAIGSASPFLLFVAAVVISAWYGGLGPGLFAGALAAVLAAYFFLEPLSSFRVGIHGGLQLLVFMLEVVLISVLSGSRRKSIEEERREREWLQTTLRSVGDGVIASNEAGRVALMNSVAESLTGWSSAEAEGKPVEDIFPAQDSKTGAQIENPIAQVLRASAPKRPGAQSLLLSKDGRRIPIEDSAAPIRDHRGKVVGAVLVFRDVSEQLRAQETLRDSEERYRTVAETASDAIITVDEKSTIVFASRACQKIFGYAPDELTGKNLTMVMPGAFRDAHLAGFAHFLTSGEKRFDWTGVELPGLHREGTEVPLEVSLGEFSRNGRRYVTGVVRDVTERKRSQEALEAERARTDEALQRHQRVEQQVMLLVEASGTLLTSLDSKEVMERMVDLAARFVKADGYAVWRTEDGTHWRAAASRGLSTEYRTRDVEAVRDRYTPPDAPLVIADVEEDPLLVHRLDGYRREGIRSLLVIPMRLEGKVSGTITFYYRTPHASSDSDVRIATALANLAAAALTTAGFYELQSRMRVEAEAAERRSRFLGESTTVLASSLDYETTLATVARLAVPHFADWCAVDMRDETGAIQRLAVVHVDPAKVEWSKEIQKRYPTNPEAERGLAKVLRTGEFEMMNDVPDELVAATAVDPEHLYMLRQIGLKSVLIVPLIARGRVLGALTFVTTRESGRNFDPPEVEIAFHLARRAAIAVDNAELYRTAERRRREAEETAELLRQSNEDLEQFAYVSSHDLQEPLRMIGSYVQLIERRYRGRLDHDADEFIAFIVEGVNRMQRLLRDLLEYARVGHRGAAPQQFESAVALEDALTNLKMALDESGAIVSHGPLPRISADPIQITQLFQNLISNAVKFRRDAPLEVRIEASRGEGEWIFSVRDNAMGFDPAYARKAFIIFQRLHGREFAGTGIGLAICKRIVERRGGRIWVESQPGSGSTFYFSIPDIARTDSAAAQNAVPSEAAAGPAVQG